MAIEPYNFENQTISASGLAAINRALFTDGALHGCAITYSGSTVRIAPGRIIIGGYVFRLTAQQTVNVSSGTSASIVVHLDLSRTSSSSSFDQIRFDVQSGSYTPTQSDLDAGSGNVYEFILCKVTRSGSSITGISYTAPSAHRRIYAASSQPSGAQTGDIWLVLPEE